MDYESEKTFMILSSLAMGPKGVVQSQLERQSRTMDIPESSGTGAAFNDAYLL